MPNKKKGTKKPCKHTSVNYEMNKIKRALKEKNKKKYNHDKKRTIICKCGKKFKIRKTNKKKLCFKCLNLKNES